MDSCFVALLKLCAAGATVSLVLLLLTSDEQGSGCFVISRVFYRRGREVSSNARRGAEKGGRRRIGLLTSAVFAVQYARRVEADYSSRFNEKGRVKGASCFFIPPPSGTIYICCTTEGIIGGVRGHTRAYAGVAMLRASQWGRTALSAVLHETQRRSKQPWVFLDGGTAGRRRVREVVKHAARIAQSECGGKSRWVGRLPVQPEFG